VEALGNLTASCDGAHCCLGGSTCFCSTLACQPGEVEIAACGTTNVAICGTEEDFTDDCLDSTPCNETWVPLLQNAGFEAGTANWNQISSGGYAVIVTSAAAGLAAQEGNYMAWLAGYANALDGVEQLLTIPPDATGLRLSGWICITTEHPAGVGPFDTASIGLSNDGGDIVDRFGFLFWDNENSTGTTSCTWTMFSGDGDSVHAGHTLLFRVAALNDASLHTSFFFDNLLLEARVCR
jgi:hypothetical protein